MQIFCKIIVNCAHSQDFSSLLCLSKACPELRRSLGSLRGNRFLALSFLTLHLPLGGILPSYSSASFSLSTRHSSRRGLSTCIVSIKAARIRPCGLSHAKL